MHDWKSFFPQDLAGTRSTQNSENEFPENSYHDGFVSESTAIRGIVRPFPLIFFVFYMFFFLSKFLLLPGIPPFAGGFVIEEKYLVVLVAFLLTTENRKDHQGSTCSVCSTGGSWEVQRSRGHELSRADVGCRCLDDSSCQQKGGALSGLNLQLAPRHTESPGPGRLCVGRGQLQV